MSQSTVESSLAMSELASIAPERQKYMEDRRSRLLFVTALLAMLVTGFGWSIASPVGSSPDDDYHLGSIWCPQPLGENCVTSEGEDGPWISVPEAVSPPSINCYAFKPSVSASCGAGKSDEQYTYSFRYDAGGYPGGYYRFHHLLVGKDVESSVIRMRMANVAIAVILIGVVAGLSAPALRRSMMLAVSATWFPMGIYFIASNNPTSWAIFGLFAFTTALFSAVHSRGYQRWLLLSAATIAALICLATRFDVSFYLFIVALALTFAVRWDLKLRWPEFVFMWAFALWGVFAMLGTGNQSAIPTGDAGASGGFSLPHLVWAIAAAPRYLAGFYGAYWWPGWVDVPTDEHSPFVLSLLAAGGVLMLALKRGSWRKYLSALMLLGAIVGLPAVFHAAGVFPVLFGYQARYILPLWGVLFFILLVIDGSGKAILVRVQQVVLVTLIAIAHSLTLYMTLLRFTRGSVSGQPRTLLSGIEWWWDISISPFLLWIVVTVTSAVFLVAATSISCRDLAPLEVVEKSAE